MADDNQAHFYQHSGALGSAVPVVLLLGIPVSVVMAAIYSYLVVYIPIVGYVNVLLLGGYILGTGYLLSRIAKASKCRNAKALFILGCVAGTVGLYAAWVFFFKAYWGEEILLGRLALAPHAVWGLAVALNEQGWWDGGPSGIFQWIVTGIEALVFIVGCGLVTALAIDREVFCERCNNWCEQAAERQLKITEEYASALETEEGNNWNHIEVLKLPEAEPNEYPRFVGEVLNCTGCGETSAIRLKLLSQKQGDNGPEEETKEIEGILLLIDGE